MLQEIDEYVITQAVANADKWLGKKGKSREVIEEGFTRSVKFPKDASKDYPPTQAVAVKHDGKLVNGVQQLGNFQVELYDTDEQLLEGESPLTHLKRGTQVTPILEAAGIWIAGKGNFGITWKLHQARVDVPGENARSGCAILDDDEGGVVVSATNGVSAAEEDAELLAAVLPKDEEDEDDGVEDDEVVEPVPVPLKKAAAATPAAAPWSARSRRNATSIIIAPATPISARASPPTAAANMSARKYSKRSSPNSSDGCDSMMRCWNGCAMRCTPATPTSAASTTRRLSGLIMTSLFWRRQLLLVAGSGTDAPNFQRQKKINIFFYLVKL
jgi:hypothetical protein